MTVEVAPVDKAPAVHAVYAELETRDHVGGVGESRIKTLRPRIISSPPQIHIPKFGQKKWLLAAVRPLDPIPDDSRAFCIDAAVGMDIVGSD